MAGAGRLGDKAQASNDAHGCPGCPHSVLGPAISGSPTVSINGRPALRVDDMGLHGPCCGTNTWKAQQGSATVFINGKAAFRLNDPAVHCGGQGKLVEASDNVLVGGATSGGGAAGDKSDAGAASAGSSSSAPLAGAAANTADSSAPRGTPPEPTPDVADVQAQALRSAARNSKAFCEKCEAAKSAAKTKTDD